MYEFICKNGNKILSEVELPRWESGSFKGKINRKAMVGMIVNLVINDDIYYGIKVLEYSIRPYTFKILYNESIHTIQCSHFMSGKYTGFIDVFIDNNNKYIDEDGVVHIYIKNRKGQEFEALYSGNHVDEVMKMNWSIKLKRNNEVESVKGGNIKYKSSLLHRTDFRDIPSHIFIDHINNNPLDNRIENLRIDIDYINNKNRKSKKMLSCLYSHKLSWYSVFMCCGYGISTKAKSILEEAKLDNLIAQKHLGCKHNEDMFYLLDNLPKDRIKEVTDLLDKKINNNKNKILKQKEYNHDIEEKEGYYILHWNDKEMLFDCGLDFIKSKNIYESNDYWNCVLVENNKKIQNRFHKELLGLRPNEYKEYSLHVDHLNGNSNDNRYSNLAITTHYSNMCNKQGKGYYITKNNMYVATYMCNYKFWHLIEGISQPSFKTEQEAIDEVNRRRQIIENARVKLHSKQELDELITYCFENGYILENGLADLDLGYLYCKGILSEIRRCSFRPIKLRLDLEIKIY